ncbi:ultraviolet-B receptor UVR8 [Pelomyxa schiedti]|nr:ultraviolet-B receptor UVR8 [Pelomyxa schiedti]
MSDSGDRSSDSESLPVGRRLVFTGKTLTDYDDGGDGDGDGDGDADEFDETSRLLGDRRRESASASGSGSASRSHKAMSSIVVHFDGKKSKAASINAMAEEGATEESMRRTRSLMRLSELRTSIRSSGEWGSSGFFDMIPDELVIKILLFTNIRTIAKISETCTRLYSLAWDLGLWNAIAKTKSWSEKQSKSYYISKYQQHKAQKEADRRAAIADRERRKMEDKKRRATNTVLCLSSRIWEWFYMLLIILFFVATTLKLEYVVDWPWIAVVSPLFAIFAHTYLFVGVFLFLQRKYQLNEIVPKEFECYRPLFNSLWFRGYGLDGSQLCACFSPLILILPFFTLVVIYMVIGDEYIPAWTLPIPLHLISIYLWVVPKAAQVGCGCDGPKQLAWQTSLCAGTALSTFLALMSVKLAWPTSVGWLGVILPLVGLEVWMVVLPLLLVIGQCCCIDMDDDEVGASLAYFGITAVLAAPLLAFEFMLKGRVAHRLMGNPAFEFMAALTYDSYRDYRWSVIMIPWYLITTLFMVFATLLTMSATTGTASSTTVSSTNLDCGSATAAAPGDGVCGVCGGRAREPVVLQCRAPPGPHVVCRAPCAAILLRAAVAARSFATEVSASIEGDARARKRRGPRRRGARGAAPPDEAAADAKGKTKDDGGQAGAPVPSSSKTGGTGERGAGELGKGGGGGPGCTATTAAKANSNASLSAATATTATTAATTVGSTTTAAATQTTTANNVATGTAAAVMGGNGGGTTEGARNARCMLTDSFKQRYGACRTTSSASESKMGEGQHVDSSKVVVHFACPICGDITSIPADKGVDALQMDLALQLAMEQKERSLSEERICMLCKKPANVFCDLCGIMSCAEPTCNLFYTQLHRTMNHSFHPTNLCSPTELSFRRQEEEQRECKEHRKPLDLFCVQDKEPLCYLCLLAGKHRDGTTGIPHKAITIEEAANECRTAIQLELDNANRTVSSLKESIDKILVTQVNLEQNCSSTMHDVCEKFDKLSKELEKRKEALLTECSQMCHTTGQLLVCQHEALAAHMKKTEATITAATSLIRLKDCPLRIFRLFEPTMKSLASASSSQIVELSETCCQSEVSFAPTGAIAQAISSFGSFTLGSGPITTGAIRSPSKISIPMHVPPSNNQKRDLTFSANSPAAQHILLQADSRQMYSWGKNDSAQLGFGDILERNSPEHSLTPLCEVHITALACGANFSVAALESGHTYSWGDNKNGQLGLGDNALRNTPQEIPALRDRRVMLIACGWNHTIVLLQSNEVFSWGYNDHGQLGIGYTTQRNTPQEIVSLRGRTVEHLACGGYHSLAVVSSLGTSSTKAKSAKKPVASSWRVFVWGYNSTGQLGLGDVRKRKYPEEIKSLRGKKITCVSCGGRHTAIAMESGEMQVWGYNHYGQLGLGDRINKNKPKVVASLIGKKVTSLACGWHHTAALVAADADANGQSGGGTVWCWGANDHGQIGSGSAADYATPQQQVSGFDGGDSIIAVLAGSHHTTAVSQLGKVYVWGELGNNKNVSTAVAKGTPQEVICKVAEKKPVPDNNKPPPAVEEKPDTEKKPSAGTREEKKEQKSPTGAAKTPTKRSAETKGKEKAKKKPVEKKGH